MNWIPDWLSTWGVIKASGFTSYLLLFISICLGAFSSDKNISARARGSLIILHQLSGWIGFLFGLLHGLVLTVDQYEPFTLLEVFVPFASDYRTVSVGLGIIALYLLLIVLFTSDWKRWFGHKTWRLIHFLVFPSYLLFLIHGLVAGSDTHNLWAILFYSGTATLFLVIIWIRGFRGKFSARQS